MSEFSMIKYDCLYGHARAVSSLQGFLIRDADPRSPVERQRDRWVRTRNGRRSLYYLAIRVGLSRAQARACKRLRPQALRGLRRKLLVLGW